MKKILFMLVLMVGCIFVNIADTSAQEIQEVNVLKWTSVNNSSLRATRNNFNFTVPYNAGYVANVSMPDSGNFKYIRVRLESGSGYGDRVNFAAVYSNNFGGYASRLATISNMYYGGNVNIIIDFKAKNATCRSDATYCVNCNIINGVSNEDYCYMSSSGRLYGIAVQNLTSGTEPRVYGGYSLEN